MPHSLIASSQREMVQLVVVFGLVVVLVVVFMVAGLVVIFVVMVVRVTYAS